jgi:hypothetical protein
MDWIAFVKRENVRKAEEILRNDFELSSQSINIRDAKPLGIEKDGSFFLISGTEEGVKKSKELIKEFTENVDDKDLKKVAEKVKEEEARAAEAFGAILG